MGSGRSAFRKRVRFDLVLGVFAVCVLTGCSLHEPIGNLEKVSVGGSYQAEYRNLRDYSKSNVIPASAAINESRCLPQDPPLATRPVFLSPLFLTPGDLLDVAIGTDTALSGKYEISSDGALSIRGLPALSAYGRTVAAVTHDVAHSLVKAGFYNVPPTVSVRLADTGSARIFVSGAVFEPGTVIIGGSAAAEKDALREEAIGAVLNGRRLSRALQSAGGIRPDADISRIQVRRGDVSVIIDARAAVTGGGFNDVVLLEGDQVTVPERGCFQSSLVVPSVVSPPGAKVFMSNLTEPASSNSESAINKEARELRYGTRMLQALVGMNCVGGSKLTNAGRTAILYSRNPESGNSIVIERNIEHLVRNANRDDYDPFILPNDALACYDSGATDIVKLAQSFGITVGAIVAGRGL